MGIDAVFDEVRNERCRQDGIWGEQNHAPSTWLMILGEEVGEANEEALEAYTAVFSDKWNAFEAYRMELIQVAAVAIAAVESLDRGKWDKEK